MKTTDYLHFINQYVAHYQEAPNPFLKAQYRRKLLGYLADYNEAATRENARTYKTIKELLIDHSLTAPGE